MRRLLFFHCFPLPCKSLLFCLHSIKITSFRLEHIMECRQIFFIFRHMVRKTACYFMPFFLYLINLRFKFSDLIFFSAENMIVNSKTRRRQYRRPHSTIKHRIPHKRHVKHNNKNYSCDKSSCSQPKPESITGIFLRRKSIRFFR